MNEDKLKELSMDKTPDWLSDEITITEKKISTVETMRKRLKNIKDGEMVIIPIGDKGDGFK